MPPSSTTLLPGPHDPYNSSSVKLAEATRIRLVLPGLGTSDKDDSNTGAVKRSNTGDLSGKPAETAAALAKARKKLLKIQGIASQADKAHRSVIVDVGVLASQSAAADDEDEDEKVAADGRAQPSSSSSTAAGRSSEAAGLQERRDSKQGAVGSSAGPGSSSSQQLKLRKAAAGGDSGKFSSRLALPSPSTSAAADAAGSIDSTGSRTAATSRSSSRGQAPDKPYVPIWERLLPPSAPAEERKAASTTHRVYQPVALKTFSPTLGSFGSSLMQQEAGRLPDEAAAMTARAAGGASRSRSAAKQQGQPPDVPAAGTMSQWRQGDSTRVTSKPVGAPAADLGLRSQSFTNGYQSPSQLFEKLTLGGP